MIADVLEYTRKAATWSGTLGLENYHYYSETSGFDQCEDLAAYTSTTSTPSANTPSLLNLSTGKTTTT